MSLPSGLALEETEANRLAFTVPEEWHQGRTAYGGLSALLALEAATRAAGGDLPPLRSATINFVGPLYGRVEAQGKLLRRGKNAVWASAEVSRGADCGLLAGFLFMHPVASALHMNERPLPVGLIPLGDAIERPLHPLMPVFLRNYFEFRYALPRSEKRQPEFCAWVRLKDRSRLDPMGELLLIADALPPGALPLLAPTTPISSMTWQINLLTPAPATQGGWWLLRSRADYAENGCSSQTMDIWNADGVPVSTGMQAMALFG